MDDLVLNLSKNTKKPTEQSKAKVPDKKVSKRTVEHEDKSEVKQKKRTRPVDERMQSQPSKTAKFSSLFKNNPDIPSVISSEANYSVKENLFSEKYFSDLGLHPHLTDCIEKRFKLKTLTTIQELVIPAILNKSNCFIKSQTGSGKTLAYAIPIIQNLQSKTPQIKRTDGIHVLILVPTRELAIQTCTVFEGLCQAFVRIVPGALIGGMKKKSEKDRIRRGLNILIATPGRLCDHLDTTMALDLSKVEYLIFDEADRMLDMDFEKKINFIIFKLNDKRKELNLEKPQTILISATLTTGITEIARRLNVENAISIDTSSLNERPTHVANNNSDSSEKSEKIAIPSSLKNYYLISPTKLRLIALISFLLDKLNYNNPKNLTKKMLIFVSTNDSVQYHENILNTFLNHKFNLYFDDDEDLAARSDGGMPNKFNLFSLYGNLPQADRIKTLKAFCQTDRAILVCTDVAARGLDMPNIDWIIQYNTPGTYHDYVHRVGRTARVGQNGKALIFLEPHEVEYINELNKHGMSLTEMKLQSIMNCLVNEANNYPRQINSDRLIIAKTSEDCANSLQFYIEEYVEKKPTIIELARKAYLTFLRSYSTYSKDLKTIFNVKNLHLGHVAKSFGLRQAPNEITRSASMSVASASSEQRKPSDPDDYTNYKTAKKPESSGLIGLLRNYKQVDEYSPGFDSSISLQKNNLKPLNAGGKPLKRLNNGQSKTKIKLNDRLKSTSKTVGDAKTKEKKTFNSKKRDMSVFD